MKKFRLREIDKRRLTVARANLRTAALNVSGPLYADAELRGEIFRRIDGSVSYIQSILDMDAYNKRKEAVRG